MIYGGGVDNIRERKPGFCSFVSGFRIVRNRPSPTQVGEGVFG